MSIFLKDDFETITIIDSSQAMLKEAERKLLEAQILNISTASKLTDTAACSAIVCLMTLHHVQDLEEIFSKASRIIESGGALMVADLYEEDGSFHLHELDFLGHNGFDIDTLTKTMLRHGFKVSRVTEYFKVKKIGQNGGEKEYPLFFLAAHKI